LIDQDSPVQIQVVNIKPNYLAIVMGAALTAMHVRLVLVDVSKQLILLRKEI
jgi:hypothetical protein